MESLDALMARHAQHGKIDWIGLRDLRRSGIDSVPQAMLTPAGLAGDHARPGKRAVTLIQAEHLAVIGALLGRDPLPPEILRRNIVVSGINLAALKGRQVALGDAVVEITTICAPCSRMEEALGPGGYSAVRGHGGWCAQVTQPGAITAGGIVRPL